MPTQWGSCRSPLVAHMARLGLRARPGRSRDRLRRNVLPWNERAKTEKMVRAGANLAAHFGEAPVLCIFCFHPDGSAVTDSDLPLVSVVGGGSVYPAVQNLLLACRAEGLGCVLTMLLCKDESEVNEILEIPPRTENCGC